MIREVRRTTPPVIHSLQRRSVFNKLAAALVIMSNCSAPVDSGKPDACANSRRIDTSGPGEINSHDNYIEIQLPNSLNLSSGRYFLDTYYEVYREDRLEGRSLRRNLLANRTSHILEVENNRVRFTDLGTPEMPLQPGISYNYSIRPKSRLSGSEPCPLSEPWTLGVQRPGTYDPENPGAYIRLNERRELETSCQTNSLPSPEEANSTDSRFRTFSFNLAWGGASRTVGIQVSRAIRGLDEDGARRVAEYVARQVQLSHQQLIQQRGFRAFPFAHYLYRVFAQIDPEVADRGGFYTPAYTGLNINSLFYPNSSLANTASSASDQVLYHEEAHRYTGFGALFSEFPSLGNSNLYSREKYFSEGFAKYLERDIYLFYQTAFEFPIDLRLVQQGSQDAQRCFTYSSIPCTTSDPTARQTCCVSQYDGLPLSIGSNAPARLQGLSFNFYVGLYENSAVLRIRRSGTTETEIIPISSGIPDGGRVFGCSDRQHTGSNQPNFNRPFGIGDICLANRGDDGQRQLLIFYQDVHFASRLNCGRGSFSEDEMLTVRNSRGEEFRLQNPGTSSPYVRASFPYEAGACFFQELEQLNPARFRRLVTTLQDDVGFRTCQAFDAIQWFADQMGVSPSIIEEISRRIGFYDYRLRRGRAVQWVREN